MSYNNTTIEQDLKAAQETEAYKMLGSFVKSLTGHAPVEGFAAAPNSVSIAPNTEVKPPLSGSVTNAFGTQYDMSDPAQVAALNREIEEHKRGRLQAIDQKIAESKIKPKDPVPAAETGPPVLSAKELVKKHGSVEKAEDAGMMEWAKAHKGLAEKVKPHQAGYDAIQLALGKTTAKPDEIRAFAEDHGRTMEESRGILGAQVETVIDGDKPMVTTISQPNNQKGAEAFKNFAIGALQGLDIGKYKDLGYNPFQIDAGKLLDQSVDFNVPGLEGTLGNYGTADYGELLKKYPNVFSYK